MTKSNLGLSTLGFAIALCGLCTTKAQDHRFREDVFLRRSCFTVNPGLGNRRYTPFTPTKGQVPVRELNLRPSVLYKV
jgi:hypothetical protein